MVGVLGRKYVNLLLSIGMVLIIILGYLAYSQIHKLNTANKWVVHSHKVIEQTDKILININYAESVIRGYFMTGEVEYLNDLKVALAMQKEDLTNLKDLISDNSVQTENVNKLASLVYWRINDIENKVKIFHEKGLKQLFQLPRTGVLVSMQIRGLISQIVAKEGELLDERGKVAYYQYVLINALIFICGISSLLLLFLGVYLLNRQINYSNITEEKLKQSEEKLYQLAYYDALTGLANRIMMHKNIAEYIALAAANNHKIALLFIDLDNFKNVNDSLGHEIGDMLLKSYAERLRNLLGSDWLIARLGGDEFVVIVSSMKKNDDLLDLARDILNVMSSPFFAKEHKIFITSSIGISIYPDNGRSSHELLKNADIAMYKAKELGKNNFQLCMPEFTRLAEERAKLDHELHRALSNNEFYLVYQPIISLKDSSLVGVEVLTRWDRPNVGTEYPDHFIRIAESNGLIMPIGEWMLNLACSEAKKWVGLIDKPIKMAVNISTRQFLLSDFAANIERTLKKTGFDPHSLELEITESVLFENSNSNLATLNTLKKMGIKISIDDFGTGYSSLSYLRTFAIDKLKIDRSFVNEITSDKDSSSIIKSIINMGHDLNIPVLAEGVETEWQLEFLRKHHCDEAQGYYFSKPLTAKELSEFLVKYKPSAPA